MLIQLTNRFVPQYRQLTVAMQRKVDKAPMSLDLDYVSAREFLKPTLMLSTG